MDLLTTTRITYFYGAFRGLAQPVETEKKKTGLLDGVGSRLKLGAISSIVFPRPRPTTTEHRFL